MKNDKLDEEYTNLMSSLADEAAKNAIAAFSEGFLLGRKYGETLMGGDDEN